VRGSSAVGGRRRRRMEVPDMGKEVGEVDG
jgi:hypothetical protein